MYSWYSMALRVIIYRQLYQLSNIFCPEMNCFTTALSRSRNISTETQINTARYNKKKNQKNSTARTIRGTEMLQTKSERVIKVNVSQP